MASLANPTIYPLCLLDIENKEGVPIERHPHLNLPLSRVKRSVEAIANRLLIA